MRRPPIALVGILALVGFLLVVTGTANSTARRDEAPRKAALIDQIMKERTHVDDLDKAVTQMRNEVTAVEAQAGRASEQQAEQNRREEALGLEAGTTAVKGPGIKVKLSDAPATATTPKFDASRIQDRDIQQVVNALFAAGAEAVAINDNRVVAVTPIRAAGGTIVVNYRPVNSPYEVSAIGADVNQFNSSDVAQHFSQWEKKYSLGFSVEKARSLTIAAYVGRSDIEFARGVTPSGGEGS